MELIEEGGESISLNGLPLELKLENVVFSYPGSDKKVFDVIFASEKLGEFQSLN